MNHLGMTNLHDGDTEPMRLTAADFARTVTPTRRTLFYRVCRLLRIAHLKLWIYLDQDYIEECERAGITTGELINNIKLRLQELRVRLAIEEAS